MHHFSISGTVENFVDGGKSIDDGWTVKLNKASFVTRAEDGAVRDHTNVFTDGTTEGTKGAAAGTWSGQFFGTHTAPVAATGTDAAVPATPPSGVAGEFNAHFSNGHVAGGFGAVKQD